MPLLRGSTRITDEGNYEHCTICLDPILRKADDYGLRLRCNHIFHELCTYQACQFGRTDRQIQSLSYSCPLCREVSKIDIEKLKGVDELHKTVFSLREIRSYFSDLSQKLSLLTAEERQDLYVVSQLNDKENGKKMTGLLHPDGLALRDAVAEETNSLRRIAELQKKQFIFRVACVSICCILCLSRYLS